jgi:hypothetical protein
VIQDLNTAKLRGRGRGRGRKGEIEKLRKTCRLDARCFLQKSKNMNEGVGTSMDAVGLEMRRVEKLHASLGL